MRKGEMMLADLVRRTRTGRCFLEEQHLAPALLRGLVDLGIAIQSLLLGAAEQGVHHVPKRTLAQILIEPSEGI